mmetsp:Transcript_22928/g.74260  ORF Transcript_22928/g.74260 Transcript_22928/m.74260 type:complete len:247 (+) Transcript_22928:1123-1863(+)
MLSSRSARKPAAATAQSELRATSMRSAAAVAARRTAAAATRLFMPWATRARHWRWCCASAVPRRELSTTRCFRAAAWVARAVAASLALREFLMAKATRAALARAARSAADWSALLPLLAPGHVLIDLVISRLTSSAGSRLMGWPVGRTGSSNETERIGCVDALRNRRALARTSAALSLEKTARRVSVAAWASATSRAWTVACTRERSTRALLTTNWIYPSRRAMAAAMDRSSSTFFSSRPTASFAC